MVQPSLEKVVLCFLAGVLRLWQYIERPFFAKSSSFKNQSIRVFDDGNQCRYFIDLAYVRMCEKANMRQLKNAVNLIQGFYLKLYEHRHYHHRLRR